MADTNERKNKTCESIRYEINRSQQDDDAEKTIRCIIAQTVSPSQKEGYTLNKKQINVELNIHLYAVAVSESKGHAHKMVAASIFLGYCF